MSAGNSHAVAIATAKSFAHLVKQHNLEVGDALVALETFVAVSILNIAIESGQPHPRRYVTEILDMMTENGINRINDLMEKGFTI